MIRNNSLLHFSILILLLCFSFCSNSSREEKSPITYTISLKPISDGLEAPVGMAVPFDGTNRLFVIEQTGKVRIIKNGQLLETPFLDVSSKLDNISSFYSEKGLLGIAFHPQYETNRKFYVYYTAPTATKGMDHRNIIAEYKASANPDVAETQERVVLTFDQPASNHNGGMMAFGSDGFLYIGTGDGGGGGDQHGEIGNGQNLKTLLGKILRISVDTPTGYSVPSDNPFQGKNANPEIWAYGLRNPWRFSFDKSTGELFCGDVGQNEWEEVNIIEKGKNYGWRIMEGRHCFNPSDNCNTSGLELPIDEYGHSVGISVIGGYVYRGSKSRDMQGAYIFGEWKGKIFMLLKQPNSTWDRRQFTIKDFDGDLNINSFGEDENGELYVLGQHSVGPRKDGSLFQIVFEH